MFKSIEYKLIVYLLLLMVSLVAATILIMREEYIYMVISIAVASFCIARLLKNYSKFNKNILFLLNAMENGDYSFNFSTDRMSRREKELNQMLNRIKDILVKARREIIKDEEFLGTIVDSVSTGILIIEGEGYVRNVNQYALQLLGMNTISHLNQLRIVDESFSELFTNLKPGENPTLKVTNEKEEAELSLRVTDINISGHPLRIITLNNIGNELEEREMESWIRLIRVMTHEIMNSIAPITSLSESLLYTYRSNSPKTLPDKLYVNTVDALETIHATTKGLLNFVESYRSFTRIPKPQPSTVSVKFLFDKVIALYHNEFTERDIQIEIISDNTEQVYADVNQIFQVLVNLIKNAVESFTATSSCNRTIKLVILQSANQITMEVCNNGEPIPQDVLPHIFIPFFTTKESGSGIGLSLSRYIMKLHGGNLKHYSDNGWTVFCMLLPSAHN